MEKIVEKFRCTGCHACYNICPKKAITMIEDEKGFKHPAIDKEKCIDCGLCKKVCPVLKEKEIENDIKAYACYNLNEKERLESSSGGIFILLAQEIIKRKGVVFGAYLNKDFKVEHIKIDNTKDLGKLMGSKYVQSIIGETYKQVKEELIEGKYVLFTGTPCQIEGLKSYLMKDYEKLYTQDIICHGVPSPLVWEKYKEYRKKTDKQTPLKISFRNKDNGWSLFNLKFFYKNDSYKKNQNEDMFMQAFLRNTILRDSCYNCKFKKLHRISDITLADYWGIQKIHPELFDNKGTSVVIISSSKGMELFESIKDKIKYVDTDLNYVIKVNPSMTSSVKADKNRNDFFDNLENIDFPKLVKKYTYTPPLYRRVLSKIKRVIKKIIKRN